MRSVLQCPGIALTFGAVSAFTIPIIIMASSLEFGKLIAASFLYRHWNTCNKTLRTYLSFAVVLLVGITSAGIYGYLSQAFEQTLSQVEGYEREIVSLQSQQGEYDRLVSAYRTSGQRVRLSRRKAVGGAQAFGVIHQRKEGRHQGCRDFQGELCHSNRSDDRWRTGQA